MSRNIQRFGSRRFIAGGVLALGLVLAPTLASAQPRMTSPPVKEMAAELQLSQEQEIEFTQIFDAHIAKTQALMIKHGIDPTGGRPSYRTRLAMKGELDQNRRQLEAELANILSVEQLEQLKEMGPRTLRP